MGEAERRAGDPFGQTITVQRGCWIGSGVSLLPGVTVGAGAVVAAGALVVDDVPENTVVAGVPAQAIKSLK